MFRTAAGDAGAEGNRVCASAGASGCVGEKGGDKKHGRKKEVRKKRQKEKKKKEKNVLDGGRRCRRRKEIACIPARVRTGGNIEHKWGMGIE